MNPTLLSYVVFIVFITGTATAASEDVIYDVSGKKALNNVAYYIGPVIWAKGGGIKLTDSTKNGKKTCPSYVVQDPDEVNKGGQFIFILMGKQPYLSTSRILDIHSGSPTGSCNMSTYWQFSDPEAKAPSNLITTGGYFDTAVTCFEVLNYPKPTSPKVHSYMLRHCPWKCGAGPPSCFNVSLYENKGVRYLASSGTTPFEFVFKRVK